MCILSVRFSMRIIFILVFAALLAITSCSKETVVAAKGVQLRIENLTVYKLDSVEVKNPAGRRVYYNINAGLKTDYQDFAFIYNYAYIKVYYNNRTVTLQPIDYAGEPAFDNGKYTYRLYIISNATSNYVNVENKKD